MRTRAVILAAAIVIAPLGAKGADLVVWWDEGYYAQEDEAVREIIAAFEQDSGKQVELVFYSLDQLPNKINAALEAGRPPDFAFGGLLGDYIGEWAFDDRLVDLTDTVGFFSNLFDPDALAWWMVLNQRTGQRALYALPMGRNTMHLHVWKSLLEQAGFTLKDIPREWDPFWSSGALRCSRPYVGPLGATRSGASGFQCRATLSTPGRCSNSLGLPTRRIT
jgi:multiple sugar transport system substrate-binding protein